MKTLLMILLAMSVCFADNGAVPPAKLDVSSRLVSGLTIKDVKLLISNRVNLSELNKELKALGWKTRDGKYTRFFLKDGAIDIPRKLKQHNVVSGHRFGYDQKIWGNPPKQ